MVPKQARELLPHTASQVPHSTRNAGNGHGSHAETGPRFALVFPAKFKTCSDRHIFEVHRKREIATGIRSATPEYE